MSTVTEPLANPLSLFDLEGHSALVTGATGAFGEAAARALTAAGASVTITGGNVEKLETLAGELSAHGRQVEFVPRRPEQEEDVEAMVRAAVDAHGFVDLLVTASGMNKVAAIVDQPVEDWDAVMAANVRGSWLVCRAVGRQMIESGRGGKVVLVSSTRGVLGHPAGYSAYCPSKAAIDLLTKTLACEWGKHRINVNAIAPTVFRSALTAWMYSDEDPGKATRDAMLARIPLGRLGEPEDFVGALIYLLSPASDFCTGQVLYVDGGYTAG
jgi:NAD(P)-dependent dehydrogenase (short-subunit alcohol dehydrogenase family)